MLSMNHLAEMFGSRERDKVRDKVTIRLALFFALNPADGKRTAGVCLGDTEEPDRGQRGIRRDAARRRGNTVPTQIRAWKDDHITDLGCVQWLHDVGQQKKMLPSDVAD